METMRQDCDILSHQFCSQQGGGTSTHVAPWCERNLDSKKYRIEKGKNLLYGCFKNNPQKDKQSKN